MHLLIRGKAPLWKLLPAQFWLSMRMTTVLTFLAVLQVSAGVTAQRITLKVHSAPLAEVFNSISRQSGVSVLYDEDLLKHAAPVTLDIKDATIEEALGACLKGQPFGFSVIKGAVVIEKRVAAGGTEPPASMPPGEVHGRVVDSSGAPIHGASVVVKGSRKGVMTEADGTFTLHDVPDDASIVVSFVGFEPQTIKPGGKTILSVRLKHLDASLNEVVVNKGYYTQKELENTGDASVVKGEDIHEQPVTDPLLALEGRVPGLYIQQTSGIPGAYSTVRIMGLNSIANGNDPLYVIDGVPFSSKSLTSDLMIGGALGNNVTSAPSATGLGISPFNMLSTDNIESITVLKDADATAIYGSRGANGVILITTKRGKAGNTKFDVNVFTGSAKVTREMKLLNTQQYLEMRHEAFNNDGLKPGAADYDVNGLWDTTRYTDWQKVLLGNPAHFSNAQVTISGGNTNTQFVARGGYSTQGVVYPGNSSDKKASANVNLTHSSTNQRFHLQLSGSYSNDNNNMPHIDLTTTALMLPPDAPALFNSKGNLNWQEYGGSSTWINPLSYLYNHNTAVANNLMGNGNISYEILNGLQLKVNAGYTREEMNQAWIDPATKTMPPPSNIASQSSTNNATSVYTDWIVEPQLSYQRKISRGSLEALVGSTFQQDIHTSEEITASDFTSDALINNPLSAVNRSIGGNEFTLYHYSALYGRLAYNWADKYLVNLTARRDGSSRFGPGKQFGNFGAVGLGWIFSGERFVQDALPSLSFGKLRASYGLTGNDQIPDYQFLSSYTPLANTYLGVAGLYPTRLPNPDYNWEVVKKLEFGLDLGFLKDRILVSGTWYQNRDGNQLVGYPLPAVTGFGSIQANFPALVQNTGVEVTLNTVNIKTTNFSWSTSINLTVPQNKLLSFPGIANTSYVYTYAVGHSLFSPLKFPFAGVDSKTGVYTFYSATYKGDTTLPNIPADLAPSRPITQSYYGGMSNKISYKGFQLDIFFQFVKQLEYNYLNYFNAPGSNGSNEPTAVLSRWQKPGDVTNIGKFSTVQAADPEEALEASNRQISDASFIRLKNVALSYQLPASWRNKVKLQNARVYLQAQNLLTITKYAGLDPEVGGNSLPPMRMITGGLQITF